MEDTNLGIALFLLPSSPKIDQKKKIASSFPRFNAFVKSPCCIFVMHTKTLAAMASFY
ncbi:hypothetical protein [Candidatus Arsenophonus triatominarum]|uniref:hypothetical protein n=1 Tax=Candidatus Arsenophonus triatominarum TaxID=57911 RepID=UPI00164F3C81|nr:hypothetical protein [Candidatus Arsenophonus triatominarum]